MPGLFHARNVFDPPALKRIPFNLNELRRRKSSVIAQECIMKTHLLIAGAFCAAMAIPFAAHAQSGATTGAVGGAIGGAVVGGPIGAVVGGIGGAIVGGISDDRRVGFREYVGRERRPSYVYGDEVRIGAQLPSSGVDYYEVPAEYGVRDYRYTVVNNRTVLVDPRTHQVIQIID
jgi:uncharacterized protein DUF1236